MLSESSSLIGFGPSIRVSLCLVEQHWNGAGLVDVDTMLAWAHRMTWKGIHPIVKLSRTVYQKGVSLSKKAMQAVEARLERNPLLPNSKMT